MLLEESSLVPQGSIESSLNQVRNGSSFAPGGQEVIVLPVNLAYILVEPLVEHLAVAVGESIDSAITPTKQ
jgi:hypothetical protein